MTSVPPPYSSRDHAQVQPVPPASTISSGTGTGSGGHEFQETTSVCLEWRLTGLKAMYESTRGDQKSKCIKSAVFGDADNLWEVLWYPNAGTSTQTSGDHVSLYLSCVPTVQERESSIQNKWTRKGLWWFKFEVRPTAPEPRAPRLEPMATKDASDHTFAVKTANWGWQAFAKRDTLFQHPQVLATDSFTIFCTIMPQPQPPAGVWLGVGLQPPGGGLVQPNAPKGVGSGGGLSAWASVDGSCGGVAGGTAAAGGVKRVVPKDLVWSVGTMLDDPLYSDIEFIIPSKRRSGTSHRQIYANKKLLNRCEYFEAMFYGGFKEIDGVYEDDEFDEDIDMLSDSDMEEDEYSFGVGPAGSTDDLHLTTTTSRASSVRRASISADRTSHEHPRESATDDERAGQSQRGAHARDAGQHNDDDDAEESAAVGNVTVESEEAVKEVQQKQNAKGSANTGSGSGAGVQDQATRGVSDTVGPAKARVIIRDAAWSTWWAVLYWLYTDIIYFAPLSSSFENHLKGRNASGSVNPASATNDDGMRSRSEWIRMWMAEHDIEPPARVRGPSQSSSRIEELRVVGPRPVSAKAVYRLADKLDLPALKLRAFQHICGQLTAGNVPAEVFSRFSSTYEDVRKVQVAFFLKHWAEIKKSETMTQIWQQIRLGKHVGFEEVWPLIVGQLDFKPS
ncbi:hypothetical protein IAU60_001442 [Kwoniella sp. DSM 27419]